MTAETVCTGQTGLRYPVSNTLRIEAAQLQVLEYELVDWDALYARGSFTPDGTAYAQIVEDALAPLSGIHADVRLLALLDVAAGPKGDVMVNLTTTSASTVYDRFLDVLDRQGLTAQAEAMRVAYAAFDPWQGTPESRRLQWTDGVGNITGPALLEVLKETSVMFLAADVTPLEKAMQLLERDPQLHAHYKAKHDIVADDTKLGYLVGLIWDCADLSWWSPEEAKAALDPLPPAVRELYVLNMFLGEAYNGGVPQVFSNSSGALVPEMAGIFAKYGYDIFASGLQAGMALFGENYPVDTNARRVEMQGFGAAENAILDQLNERVFDSTIEALMVQIAKDAGLWPE
ncbi:MAG: DUF4375 domain-containing protein [Roseovarius sp.]